ncbi:hypothetical protein [Asticcacaulis tiandongensis]|uniref:hypothetical protein n=1 Tax=Asticcacaulis tiandongensis TaxID=2565365 RepID=UPI00112DB73F|nr:hypothetical protein [Asticcacaulis tiandongensis]
MIAKISWLAGWATVLAAIAATLIFAVQKRHHWFTGWKIRSRAEELITLYGTDHAKAEALIRCIEAWRRHDRKEAQTWDRVAQHLGRNNTDEVRQ